MTSIPAAARRLNEAVIVDDAQPLSTAPTAARFRPDVQGLRGLAVLLVVIYHSGYALSGGFVGVDVFFVISGFVIVRSLHSELSANGRVDLVRFYTRRIRRLLPAFAIASILTLIGTMLVLSPTGEQQRAAQTAMAASLFVANQALFAGNSDYFGPGEETNPFLHTWSLSLEEQFYFVLPVTIAFLWWFWRRRAESRPGGADPRRSPTGPVAASIGLLAAVSLLGAWILTGTGNDLGFDFPTQLAFYAMPLRLWEFAAGVLLAFLPSALRLRSAAVSTALVAGAGFVLLAVSISYDERTVFPGVTALLPVLAAGLLILVTPGSPIGMRALGSRPLTLIGDVSYGWYLLHWPAIVFARRIWDDDLPVIASIAVSFVLSVVLYRVVEEPIRHNSSIAGRRAIALAAVCIAVPVAAAGTVGYLAGSGRGASLPPGRGSDALPAARVDGCMIESLTAASQTWDASNCLYNGEATGGLVLLLGDSHAASLSDVVIAAGAQADLQVAVWARASCPFVGRSAPGYEQCEQWQSDAHELIAELEPDAVVIANRSPSYILAETGTRSPLGPIAVADGTAAADRPDALDAWASGLDETLQLVTADGVEVIVVNTVPEYPAGSFVNPSIIRPEPDVPTISTAEVAERRGDVAAIEADVASGFEGVSVFDPVRWLCPDGRCSPVRDGHWIYSDNHHLNSYASAELGPELARFLTAAVEP